MTPAELLLLRDLIRTIRASARGTGILGPAALNLANAVEVLMRDHERQQSLFSGLLTDIHGLIDESSGVYGLHLNGDPSPWDELLPGGRFERLTNLVEIDDIHRNGSESK